MACEMDNLQLIDFLEEDDCLIPFPFRDSLVDIRLSERRDNVNVCDHIEPFRGVNSHAQFESLEPRRLSFLRKSIDWDSFFFTSAGLLNPEELCMINKSFKKDELNLSSSGAKKHIRPLRVSSQDLENLAAGYSKHVKPHIQKLPKRSKASINISENMRNKPRKAGANLTSSKRSPKGDLSSKSTSFTCATTEKKSKAHRSNESSFGASPKRKNNLRNTKSTTSPSSVLSPLSSTCSFSTSPARSSPNAILASDLQSSCENIGERKFACHHAKRSSTRNIKSPCLQMPDSKIGFFDEEQPIFKGSTHCATMAYDMDNLQLIDFLEEDDCLIPFPLPDSLEDIPLPETFDDVNVCDLIELFRGVNSHAQSELLEPRRLSYLRKSIDWDSLFFTSAGLLNPKELNMINKGFKKEEFNLSSYGTEKDIRPLRAAGQDQISSNRSDLDLETLAADHLKNVKPYIHKLPKRSKIYINTSENMGNKTRRGDVDFTLIKRSPNGDLSSKSASFTCATTEKNSKAHCSNESSFSASPKRNDNLRNTRSTTSPSSVLSPSSSTCSFCTSPARGSPNAIWASDIQSSSANIGERKFASQHAKRSSIGNIKSSRLRMPSPKIGFFDEEQLVFKGSTHGLNKLCPSNHSPFVSTENCSRVKKNLSRDDSGIFQGNALTDIKKKQYRSDQHLLANQQENVCGFEVNGLIFYRDVTEVKGQQRCVQNGRPSLPPIAENTTRCSRTLFAEKKFEPKGPSFWCKSLDWDSALFTSTGLLDAEELSMINESLKSTIFWS